MEKCYICNAVTNPLPYFQQWKTNKETAVAYMLNDNCLLLISRIMHLCKQSTLAMQLMASILPLVLTHSITSIHNIIKTTKISVIPTSNPKRSQCSHISGALIKNCQCCVCLDAAATNGSPGGRLRASAGCRISQMP